MLGGKLDLLNLPLKSGALGNLRKSWHKGEQIIYMYMFDQVSDYILPRCIFHGYLGM